MNQYTFHITLYDVALLGIIPIGATFVLLLWFTRNRNRAANRYFALALGVMVLRMAWLAGIDIGLDTYLPRWDYLPLQFLLAPGPLLFFYVSRLTRPTHKFGWKGLAHFIPLLFEQGVFAFAVNEAIRTGLATYHTTIFQQLGPVLRVMAFISVITYLYLSHRLIQNFYRLQKFNNGDRYRHEWRWLHRLLTGFGLLWLLWVPCTFIDYYYHHRLSTSVNHPLSLAFTVMFILIAIVVYLRPENGLVTKAASPQNPIFPAELRQQGTWLKKTMKAKRYYTDPELSLSTLAEKLELTTHELSRIINMALKKSFNDFVNEYRVADVIKKMQDPDYDHITLLGIAYESGFNSQSTFNRIFKQMTAKSPVEYKNDLKKEYPTYNSGSWAQLTPVALNHEPPKKWFHGKLNRHYMFKNYFKIAQRNLLRNKAYSAINITGLAVGIAVCMTIFIIIRYQTSFDNFHAKKDRTYRVLSESHHQETGNITYGRDLPFPLPRGLKTAFPQVEQVAPIFASHDDQILIPGDNGATIKTFKEQQGLFYAGPSFFKIFDFPLLAGSYESLKDPDNVFLTKEIAERYFGDWKLAMGKTIKLQMGGFIFEHGTDVLKVSGILAPVPANFDFQLKLVVSFGSGFTGSYLSKSTEWYTTVADFGCFVLLPPNMAIDNFNRQLQAYSRTVQSAANKDSYTIQPLNAIHYDTGVGDYSNQTISHQMLNVLWLIAAFILLIACVNFVNLSTAQAINRAKEIGVRKVLGGRKSQLQTQFIVETFLIVASAVILAVVITLLALPYVGQVLDLSLSVNLFTNPAIILFVLTVTVIVTALAGFYPSMVLSRFNPVNALKSKLISNTNGISLRRGLVVFQFIIAQALIIGTLIIVRQMNYFMDQPLGFDKDAIINVPFRVDSVRIARIDYLKKQLLSVSGVQAVSFSSNTPVENGNDMWSRIRFNHAAKDADFGAIVKLADNDYVPTYKLQLVAGRNLQPSKMVSEFLVNESLVKSLGIKNPEEVINKNLSTWNSLMQGPIVGVVKDFNDRSFRQNLAPLVITTDVAMYSQATVKLYTTHITATMQAVKKVFEQTNPDFVYEYKFLDEKIAGFYKQESQLAALYKIFAAVAIFLSCLGLYGLASFMAVQRIKEVGIRKVLGATAGNIVYLFSKEFIILITIAFAIAAPIAWYYMHQWLQAYVYRINISWWLFAAGGLAAIIIALATISFQAIRAAVTNPVKSLRSE